MRAERLRIGKEKVSCGELRHQKPRSTANAKEWEQSLGFAPSTSQSTAKAKEWDQGSGKKRSTTEKEEWDGGLEPSPGAKEHSQEAEPRTGAAQVFYRAPKCRQSATKAKGWDQWMGMRRTAKAGEWDQWLEPRSTTKDFLLSLVWHLLWESWYYYQSPLGLFVLKRRNGRSSQGMHSTYSLSNS
jgi:hypothetical protein